MLDASISGRVFHDVDGDGAYDGGKLVVASWETNAVLQFDGAEGTSLGRFIPAEATPADFPSSFAFSPDGDLLVTSFHEDRILRYDGATGEFLDVFASGSALDGPMDLAFGPDGNLYVASWFNDSVERVDSTTGELLGQFASGGGLDMPASLVFGDDGNLYVSGFASHSIVRFDGQTGSHLGAFVPTGGGVTMPWQIAFGPDGHLYVAAFAADSVLRFNGTSGALLDTFATGGGLDGPTGLKFGPDGNLYVTSANSDALLRYDGLTGEFLDVLASGPELGNVAPITFSNDGEAGLTGWTVYLDANDDGALDPGELTTTTDAFGRYRFDGLADGEHVVRAVPANGLGFSAPIDGAHRATLADGDHMRNADFGVMGPRFVVGINAAAIDEVAGVAAATGTVTRVNVPDLTVPLTVTLNSSDTTEAAVPATVTIPAGVTSVAFAIDAVDDLLFDGTQTVMVTATAAGYLPGSDTLRVDDNEVQLLAITLETASVSEAAGAVATRGTVTRTAPDVSAPLVVTLESDDTSEATVPATVTILAGALSATFDVTAIDDSEVDGTQTVTFTATATDHESGTTTLDVLNDDLPSPPRLAVTTAEASISEAAGPGATTVTVTRTDPINLASALVVALESSDVSEASVPATVTIPAGAISATVPVAAHDDSEVDGTQTISLTATAAGYVTGTSTLDVLDDDTLPPALDIAIQDASIGEAGGPSATTATITRANPIDLASPLTVTLDSSDPSEATVPAIITIPAGATSIVVSIAAVDDTEFDGTQTVMVTATATGYSSASATVNVLDDDPPPPPALMVTIAEASITEADGPGATTVTITRVYPTDLEFPLTVTLASDDTSEATVPTTITVPAGAPSIVVSVDAVDDTEFDGTQTVTISATAAGYVSASATVEVLDDDPPPAVLAITIEAASIGEPDGANATTVTVTRINPIDLASPLMVNLESDDTGEATVPATITIPAGVTSFAASIAAVDDTEFDGTQTVTITATATGYTSASATVDVLDDDPPPPPILSVTIDATSVNETDGANAATVTVTRINPIDLASPLTVMLASSDMTEATVPATATIPAGADSVTIPVAAVDDTTFDGTQTVTITASATDYASASVSLDVLDDDPQPQPALDITITETSISEADGANAATVIVRRIDPIDLSSPLVVSLASSDTSEATVPATLTIPAGSASIASSISAVDDTVFDGTQTVTFTATANGYTSASTTLDVLDDDPPPPRLLNVMIAATSIHEADGANATTITITRINPIDIGSALTVTLASSDTSEATVPATVTIPAGITSTVAPVAAVDDTVFDGTQTVTITATATGYTSANAILDVLDDDPPPELNVAIASTAIYEAGGKSVTSVTVTRFNPIDLNSPLNVTLTSSDTSEAVLPATATIPAGEISITTWVAAVDDAEFDGAQTVTITASATDYVSASDTLDVLDNEPPPPPPQLLAVTTDTTVVSESNSKPVTVTVRRINPLDASMPLIVTLASSDTNELTIPSTVTLPAGVLTVTAEARSVDDGVVDGTKTVTITATAPEWVQATAIVSVLDNVALPRPTLAAEISAASIGETDGANAATITVTRVNPVNVAAPLLVTLISSDASEADVPLAVTIPAGATSVTVPIAAIDDTESDGTQTVTITAESTGYIRATASLDVLDDEPPPHLPPLRFTSSGGTLSEGLTRPTLSLNSGTLAPFNRVDDVHVTNFNPELVTFGSDLEIAITQAAARRSKVVDGATLASLAGTGSDTVTLRVVGYLGSSVLVLRAADIATDSVALTDAINTVTASTGVAAEGVGHGADVTLHSGIYGSSGVATLEAISATVSSDATLIENAVASGVMMLGLDVVGTVTHQFGSGPVVVDPLHGEILNYSDEYLTLWGVTDPSLGTSTVALDIHNPSMGSFVVSREGAADISTPLTVTLTSSDTSEVTIPATFTISAGEVSTSFPVQAVDDDEIDGRQVVTVTASSAGFASGSTTFSVLDDESPPPPELQLTTPSPRIGEGGGTGAATITVMRLNTIDLADPLVVKFTHGEQATVPSLVTIPPGAVAVTVPVNVIDDAVYEGTHVAGFSAEAEGYPRAHISFQIFDNDPRPQQTLGVTVADASIAEGAGPAATTITVTRNHAIDLTQPLAVTLTSSDTSEATVPATITIPAGVKAISVDVAAVDDTLYDGTQTVILTATATDYTAGATTLEVSDDDPPPSPLLAVAIAAASVNEGAGANATTVTVTRINPVNLAAPLTVVLASSDTSEATVPATVTIPAGATFATTSIAAVDDTVFDGTQSVTITATASGYASANDTLEVLDNDPPPPPVLTVEIAAESIGEADGVNATTATVTRLNPIDLVSPLTVTLASSDTSEATVPTTVTIPAGATSATVSVAAVDDPQVDGTQPVTINATAAGYTSGSDTIDVLDDDVPPVDTQAPSAAVNVGDISSPTATHDLTVTYADDVAILVNDLDNNNIRVVGPNGFFQLAMFVSVDDNTNGTPRTAVYRIAAPGGVWSEAHNGTYTVLIRPGEVHDTVGKAVPEQVLGTFAVNVVVNSNGAPVAAADQYVLPDSGGPIDALIGVLRNDSDPNGDPIEAELTVAPTRGAVALAVDGTFRYTPFPSFTGFDEFVYTVRDGAGASSSATVKLMTHDAALVYKLFGQVLGREPDMFGWEYWIAAVKSGVANLGTIASSIFESNERLDPIISQMYEDYLLRPIDAEGLRYWRDESWKKEGSPDHVMAGIIGSAEFFESAGGTNRLWVEELYRRMMGRIADEPGAAFWIDLLDRGVVTREGVVLGFIQSEENYRHLVILWYQTYLERTATEEEIAGFVGQMLAGASQREIQIQLLNSAEYRNTPRPAATFAEPML